MKEKLHTGSPLSRNRQAFGAERLMTLLAGNRASRGDSPWDLCRPWAVSRQISIGDFRRRIRPSAAAIRQQKQPSSSPPSCARRQYRIYSDNAAASEDRARRARSQPKPRRAASLATVAETQATAVSATVIDFASVATRQPPLRPSVRTRRKRPNVKQQCPSPRRLMVIVLSGGAFAQQYQYGRLDTLTSPFSFHPASISS